MIEVKLYSRQGCHLCEEVKDLLGELHTQYPHQLIEIDIESSNDLLRAYGLEIPVVQIGPYTLKAPITRVELAMTLGAAQDRQRHLDEIESSAYSAGGALATWSGADRFSLWLARHYMAMFNFIVFLYVGLPILAPTFMKAGAELPATVIYKAYSLVCHQLAYRSFFLYGEQPVYPRSIAGLEGLLTYNQATGMSESTLYKDIQAAEKFIGNPELGYKVALCQRDIAIYGGMLLFGVIFVLTGKRIPVLPWYLWILIGLFPIGLDGLSQLVSQLPIDLLPVRESTPQLRVLTGALFGITTAWFGYPMVEESMLETRQMLGAKYNRIQRYTKPAAGSQ